MTATLTATLDTTLMRVKLAASGLNAATAKTTILRWENGEPKTLPLANTVRGSDLGAHTSGTVSDYEWAEGVANSYRLISYNSSGTVLDTVNASDITPSLSGEAWLKSIARPFLNQPLTITGWSDVTRPARGSALYVLGRSAPVAITEIRSARQYTLTVRAASQAESRDIATFLSFGDVVLLQIPASGQVPGGYFMVGDAVERRPAKHDSGARYWDLPLTEVAAPDPTLVGFTVTWAAIVAHDLTWAAVVSEFATWNAVTSYVANPDEIIP